MTAIYNEIEPYAAQWLRNLSAAGHIAEGNIDDRSIADIQPDDIRDATQFHTFAGIGVWSHALRLAGWPDDLPVWTGSCPCQPFSTAGKGKGTADERHLWPEWRRLIAECRPAIIFGEQVASPAGRDWLAAVRSDLEALGYAVGAADLCAAGVGAPHIRQRLFFVAYADQKRRVLLHHLRPQESGRVAKSQTDGRCSSSECWSGAEWLRCKDNNLRAAQPGIFPLANGTPGRVGQLCAYGNAIVAPLAAEFIRASVEALAE